MLGHLWKQNLQSFKLLSQTALVCCVLLLVVGLNAFLNNNIKLETVTMRGEAIQEKTVPFSANLPESEHPICTGNLLNGQEYHYSKWARGFSNSQLVSAIKQGSSCRLLSYTTERIVACLDDLHDHLDLTTYQNMPNITAPHKSLHFVFMGDSRIRQQFFNFVKLIPEYDKKSQPSPVPSMYHGDIEVTSNILKLRVSFRWRPMINTTVTETIRQWAVSNLNDERPDLLFLSMVIHHMLKIHNTEDYKQLYQKRLVEFAPILNKLAKDVRVIWLNQYPTLELNKPTSKNVHSYNIGIRHIFESHSISNIRIWDSSNPLVEEYIRSCIIFERKNSEFFWGAIDYATPYINCNDNVHPGYSVLSQATQLLFNDICNN